MRVITVIDGDTVLAVDRPGRRRKLRLEGIDAPEKGQRNSREATQFIRQACGSRWVQVQLLGRDRYRRHLARIRVQGESLERSLVSAGLAYPLSARYSLAGLRARAERRGVHAGWGQRTPWQSASRSKGLLGRLLRRGRTRP